jgi:hypothetical protein
MSFLLQKCECCYLSLRNGIGKARDVERRVRTLAYIYVNLLSMSDSFIVVLFGPAFFSDGYGARQERIMSKKCGSLIYVMCAVEGREKRQYTTNDRA